LCGVYNTSEACNGEDWRQSYADKIVRYIQDYANHGVAIDYVGFLNEPDLSTPYASMQSSGRQAADFIKVLHPALQAAGLATEIACCDGSGWEQQRARLTGIQRYHQEKNLGLVTSHGYSSYPGAPFDTDLHVWQTEWSTFDTVNYNWYTPGGSESDGITWANNIHNSFADSNVNGFLYWWGMYTHCQGLPRAARRLLTILPIVQAQRRRRTTKCSSSSTTRTS
jgi:O-glycosyl hydrolase